MGGMDISWIKHIKWDEIFTAAFASELGLIGLSTLALSFLTYMLYQRPKDLTLCASHGEFEVIQ